MSTDSLPAGSIHLADIELSKPLPVLRAPSSNYGRAQLLVCLFERPVAIADVPLRDAGAEPAAYAPILWNEVAEAVNARLRAEGLAECDELPASGLRLIGEPTSVRQRRAFLEGNPPFVSVVLCTRDRPQRLVQALSLLLAQTYPCFEVVVVDNAPDHGAVRQLLGERFHSESRVRYVPEPRPGLSVARNRGARHARGEFVAFIDDDEQPDSNWLLHLIQAFSVADDVAAVSGAILPAELQTPAQMWFEQYGGHSKGRGLEPAVFDPASHARQSPLFPVPPFGAGGNMAFRAATLRAVGGFDEVLGAGTPVAGAEDTAILLELMLAGHTVVYEPSAYVRHTHHREFESLRRQLYGYGAGLTAFYARIVIRHPERIPELLRLAPTAVRYYFGRGSARTVGLTSDFPRMLRTAQFRGLASGPFAYAWSWASARRNRARTTEAARELGQAG